MTVIECQTSPGDTWVKVSKHLLEHGVRVGNLTEELNVVTEITEFKSDDWFDGHFREIMGDDRIDFTKQLHSLNQNKRNQIIHSLKMKKDWITNILKTIGINLIGVEWYLGKGSLTKLRMLLRFSVVVR